MAERISTILWLYIMSPSTQDEDEDDRSFNENLLARPMRPIPTFSDPTAERRRQIPKDYAYEAMLFVGCLTLSDASHQAF